MTYGLDHLSHATNFGGGRFWYFDRVYQWQSKRDAIVVLLEDLPQLVEAEKAIQTHPHPTNPLMGILDPRPRVRLVIACEGVANTLYSCAEIAANFANLASRGGIPSSFNAIRKKCEEGSSPELAAQIGDLQWYGKVRELRTEWAHYSSIFVGKHKENEPILCVKSFRRNNDRREFAADKTFCEVRELCGWVERAVETLERFAGYLLVKYVIPQFGLEEQVTWVARDHLGFPQFNSKGGVVTEKVTYREYLRRGGINVD